MLSVVVSICTPTYSLFTLFLSLNTTWSFLLKTMAKCLFNAFPYLVFSFCSTVAQHIPCLFSLCCWGAILSICFISFAKPNSVGFLTVQTLSLYFLTSQVLLVCGRYFWCPSWTLLISSPSFRHGYLFKLGLESLKGPAGCTFVKAACSIYWPFSVLQNRHNEGT